MFIGYFTKEIAKGWQRRDVSINIHSLDIFTTEKKRIKPLGTIQKNFRDGGENNSPTTEQVQIDQRVHLSRMLCIRLE